jgi:hypothetical protein
VRARLAALALSLLLAVLAARLAAGGEGPATGVMGTVREHAFEVALLLGYAVLHPWLQKRWNPTGAFTGVAARKLELVAHVDARR